MPEADVYQSLAERLNYGASKYLPRILKKLATPEQASLILELPAPPQELAQRLKMDVDTVNKLLDDLYAKGVIFPKDFKTREGYRFARSVMQLHDATECIQSLDEILAPELFELWEEFCQAEWYRDFAANLAKLDKPEGRVIPSYKAIQNNPGMLPCEDVREILRANELISATPCPCRRQARRCTKSGIETENCLQFGRGAEYAISRGTGGKLSYDEALAIIDSVEEDGLVHSWMNSTQLVGRVMCNCCDDCCVAWVPPIQNGVSIGKRWAKSRYVARVDQDLCSGCQTCIDRCQFDAIEMQKPPGSKKYKAIIDPEKCWGCGVCFIKCDPRATTLELVRPAEHIPSHQT